MNGATRRRPCHCCIPELFEKVDLDGIDRVGASAGTRCGRGGEAVSALARHLTDVDLSTTFRALPVPRPHRERRDTLLCRLLVGIALRRTTGREHLVGPILDTLRVDTTARVGRFSAYRTRLWHPYSIQFCGRRVQDWVPTRISHEGSLHDRTAKLVRNTGKSGPAPYRITPCENHGYGNLCVRGFPGRRGCTHGLMEIWRLTCPRE